MKILLVDDDASSLQSLETFLKEIDHQVKTATNGKEAMNMLYREAFHLVISDIRMPKMDGKELLDTIKSSPDLQHIDIVLITAYGDIKSAVEAMKAGASEYLIKPVDIDELSIIIDRIAELQALREESKLLKAQFNEKLSEATLDIKKELEDLKKAYAKELGISEIGVFSDKMKEVFSLAKKLHQNREIPVLIEGETGTGKEIIAKYIHYSNGSVTSPFIALNCAAITPGLFESELFGYEPGAFTGGNPKGQKGKLELAKGGTIFFDEIGELPPEFQAKLLRVIQEREFYRVGGIKKFTTDVRIICATNIDVEKFVVENKFRTDLYYRFSAGHIKIPPLRARRESIIPFAKMFLKKMKHEKKISTTKISTEAESMLTNHDWSGNIRELKNLLERLSFILDGDIIEPKHLEFLLKNKITPAQDKEKETNDMDIYDLPLPDGSFDFNKLTENIIKKALVKHRYNKTMTAKYLGLSRSTLYTYLNKLE